jgi:hypothetical protein
LTCLGRRLLSAARPAERRSTQPDKAWSFALFPLGKLWATPSLRGEPPDNPQQISRHGTQPQRDSLLGATCEASLGARRIRTVTLTTGREATRILAPRPRSPRLPRSLKTESYARFSVLHPHFLRGRRTSTSGSLGEREVASSCISQVATEVTLHFPKPELRLCASLGRGNLATLQIQLESLILAQNER